MHIYLHPDGYQVTSSAPMRRADRDHVILLARRGIAQSGSYFGTIWSVRRLACRQPATHDSVYDPNHSCTR